MPIGNVTTGELILGSLMGQKRNSQYLCIQRQREWIFRDTKIFGHQLMIHHSSEKQIEAPFNILWTKQKHIYKHNITEIELFKVGGGLSAVCVYFQVHVFTIPDSQENLKSIRYCWRTLFLWVILFSHTECQTLMGCDAIGTGFVSGLFKQISIVTLVPFRSLLPCCCWDTLSHFYIKSLPWLSEFW